MYHREATLRERLAGALVLAGASLLAVACVPGLYIPPGSYSKHRLYTHNPGTLRVLHIGPTAVSAQSPPDAALDDAGFAALWSKHRVAHPRPKLDLTRWVVVAHTDERSPGAPREITKLRISRRGMVRIVRTRLLTPASAMTFGKYSQVTILAIARKELPKQGIRFQGRTIHFPKGAAPLAPEAHPAPPATPAAGTLAADAAGRGTVTVPPKGTVALVSLKDRTPVWVVHHKSGELTVLAANHALPLPGLRGLRAALRWRPWARRFCSLLATQREYTDCYDERGTSVLGLHRPPLDRYAYRVVAATAGGKRQLVIGARSSGPRYYTVAPRDRLLRSSANIDHLLLEPAAAKHLALKQALTQPDGTYVVFRAALDVKASGGALLCAPAHAGKGCPAGSTPVADLQRVSTDPRPVKHLTGPFGAVVKAGKLTHLTWFGHGALGR